MQPTPSFRARAIAMDAEIDPALVMRYFGNKEKLFAAAADFDLRLPKLGDLPRDQVGAALVRHFIQRWEADNTFMALLRVAVTNEAAAQQVTAVFAGQVLPALGPLAGSKLALRAGLVSSQILGLALSRYVLRLPPAVAMTEAEVVACVGATLQHYITGDLSGPLVR